MQIKPAHFDIRPWTLFKSKLIESDKKQDSSRLNNIFNDSNLQFVVGDIRIVTALVLLGSVTFCMFHMKISHGQETFQLCDVWRVLLNLSSIIQPDLCAVIPVSEFCFVVSDIDGHIIHSIPLCS